MAEERTEIGNLITEIRKTKGISLTLLSQRLGYTNVGTFSHRLCGNMGLELLCSICNQLGVEICIIDGWAKHRLNDFQANKDLDVFINEVARNVGRKNNIDKVGIMMVKKEQQRIDFNEKVKTDEKIRKRREECVKKYRENHRDRFYDYHRLYRTRKKIKDEGLEDTCLKCKNCKIRLADRYDAHYCMCHERYEVKIKCKDFEEKDK